jgi:hypothetical protein
MKSSAGTKKYKYVFPESENDQLDNIIAALLQKYLESKKTIFQAQLCCVNTK